MVTGVIDQIEGHFATAEFEATDGQVMVDIVLTHLPNQIKEGDVLRVYSVNGIDLNDEDRCVYKDISKKSVLQKFLEPLSKTCESIIEVDVIETQERSSQMKSLISNLFAD